MENNIVENQTNTPPDLPLSQALTFEASDGTLLNGTYYPAADSNAPLIVLMHWARGDQNDYTAIASWLQNRGGLTSAGQTGQSPWLDAAWFPAMPVNRSYAVFTFSFRNCEGGCPSFLSAEWLDDAQSALDFAWNLDGIDNTSILVAGVSIGADGAADGCLYLNQQHPGACKGAFSISPGSYLTRNYAEVVAALSETTPATPAWCLYADSDSAAVGACAALKAANFTAFDIGNAHGMNLVEPQVQPNPLDLLLDFLADTID